MTPDSTPDVIEPEARLLRKHIDGIFTADPKGRRLAYGDFNEHSNESASEIEVSGMIRPAKPRKSLLKPTFSEGLRAGAPRHPYRPLR